MHTFLNELIAAQLDLCEPVASVAQVDDGIALQPLLV